MPLKEISIMWSLIHTLIMFLFLFESRYPKKKTLTLTVFTMTPLVILSLILFVVLDAASYLQIMLVTLSLPSFIVFWILSKHRDGRFVFTFCIVDTIVLEILYITNIIDHYIPGDWFLFIVRLIAYPLLELFIYKKFHTMYHNIQAHVKKGWWLFAFIGIMYYIGITFAMSFPTIITDRPEYMPLLVILFMLMPASYLNVFITLMHQKKVYEAIAQENILKVQVAAVQTRADEFSAANNKFRTERHDFRHKLQTISRMIKNEEYDELVDVIDQYTEAIEETSVKRYCENAVLDAVLSSYLQSAENSKIKITSSIRLPETLTVSDAELATVFANAIENAINACERIEPKKRVLDIKVISSPRFMLKISNSFDGNVEFDENNVPVTYEEGHGFGTRSIVTFCEKNNAFYEFKVEENHFSLVIVF